MEVIVIGATGTIGTEVAKAYIASLEGTLQGMVIDPCQLG